MFTLVLIGFVGGLITGVSPYILPVLPVIFFSGTQSVRGASVDQAGNGVATAVETKPSRSETLRPYRVIGGLVLSFSLITLLGSAALTLLNLPQDAIRWIALVALVAIGLGLVSRRSRHCWKSRSPSCRRSNSVRATVVSASAWLWVCCMCRARVRYSQRS